LSLFLFIGVVALLSTGSSGSIGAATPAQRNPEDSKALVRRWIDQGFNKRDLTVVDAIFIPEVIINGQRVGGLGLKKSMSRFLSAFPNLRVTITEIVAEGDKVVIWYSVQGTQTGEFDGIRATGKQVRWIGADLFRIMNGKIVECLFLDDSLGLLRQLGATISSPK
jgi:predicted ester cyclase